MTDVPGAGREPDTGGEAARRRAVGGWKAARWARRVVQVAALAIFVYLLFTALQRRAGFSETNIFIRLDPLAAIATMLSARDLLRAFALAAVTIVATLLVGRVWCGWVCPMGTLLGWVRFRSARRWGSSVPPALRSVKYVLLGVILVMAAFAGMTLMVLDPITLLTRTATTSLLPSFVYVVNALERAGLRWSATAGTVAWVEDHFRGTWLPMTQPRYSQAAALLALFLAIVLLNALADRLWCRYLCPLGALLGLVAKIQVLRPFVGVACDSCATCARSCRVDAIEMGAGGAGGDAPPARVVTSECTMCLDCFVACPRPGAISLGTVSAAPGRRPGPWESYDPKRREALAAIGAGVGAVVLLGTGVWRAFARPGLIRPPGAQDEAAFLSRCLRCSECMKVCPTSGLQPTLGEAGLEGLWTPVLTSRLGYCDYSCTACGEVCPSGAIPRLGLAEKRRQILGVAVIDRDRCLPWAQNTPCIVCEEVCPVPDKAVVLGGQRLITRPDGSQDYLSRPRVIEKRCIGCGLCEFKCPLEGTAAIVVVPTDPELATTAPVPLG